MDLLTVRCSANDFVEKVGIYTLASQRPIRAVDPLHLGRPWLDEIGAGRQMTRRAPQIRAGETCASTPPAYARRSISPFWPAIAVGCV